MFGSDYTHRATNRTWVVDTRSWQWVTSVSKVDPTPPIKIVVRYDDNGNDNDAHVLPYNKIAGSVVGGIACLVMYYSLYFISSIQFYCIHYVLMKLYIYIPVYYISKRRRFFLLIFITCTLNDK